MSTSASNISLKRDVKGRIIRRILNLGQEPEIRRYVYDAAGCLTRVTGDSGGLCESYLYDGQGRRLAEINPMRFRGERRYTYSPGDRLLQAGRVQYGHDKAGFRTLKTVDAGSQARETRYRYEPSGLLLAVELPGSVIEYVYDSDGMRQEKRVDGQVTERYRWLDPLRLSEFHDGAKWWRLAYDGPGRTPVGLTDGRASFFLYSDHLGTPLALADLDGNIVQAMRYDSFGNLLETRGEAVRLPLGFAGGLFDADTGLTRAHSITGWRDYDAGTGRFTALDPLGAMGGDSDWYGYCVHDPVNRVDAWGLMGVVWELPTTVLTKAPKFIRDKLGLDPMPKERIIKEITDNEIANPSDNSTWDQPSEEQWKGLKKDMDNNGVPSELEAIKRFVKDKGLWPF